MYRLRVSCDDSGPAATQIIDYATLVIDRRVCTLSQINRRPFGYYLISQIFLWSLLGKLFLNIFGQFIVLQLGQKMNKIRPVMSEIPDCKGVLRG